MRVEVKCKCSHEGDTQVYHHNTTESITADHYAFRNSCANISGRVGIGTGEGPGQYACRMTFAKILWRSRPDAARALRIARILLGLVWHCTQTDKGPALWSDWSFPA